MPYDYCPENDDYFTNAHHVFCDAISHRIKNAIILARQARDKHNMGSSRVPKYLKKEIDAFLKCSAGEHMGAAGGVAR
jgi:hypothetical protein